MCIRAWAHPAFVCVAGHCGLWRSLSCHNLFELIVKLVFFCLKFFFAFPEVISQPNHRYIEPFSNEIINVFLITLQNHSFLSNAVCLSVQHSRWRSLLCDNLFEPIAKLIFTGFPFLIKLFHSVVIIIYDIICCHHILLCMFQRNHLENTLKNHCYVLFESYVLFVGENCHLFGFHFCIAKLIFLFQVVFREVLSLQNCQTHCYFQA